MTERRQFSRAPSSFRRAEDVAYSVMRKYGILGAGVTHTVELFVTEEMRVAAYKRNLRRSKFPTTHPMIASSAYDLGEIS